MVSETHAVSRGAGGAEGGDGLVAALMEMAGAESTRAEKMGAAADGVTAVTSVVVLGMGVVVMLCVCGGGQGRGSRYDPLCFGCGALVRDGLAEAGGEEGGVPCSVYPWRILGVSLVFLG